MTSLGKSEFKIVTTPAKSRVNVVKVAILDSPQNQTDSNHTGSYDHPPGCVGDECNYRASWSYREKSKNVHFELEAKVGEEEWIAIGFSEDKNMVHRAVEWEEEM